MSNNLSYSQKGLSLTEQFEGLKLNAYRDCAGVWTIGYGHTGPDVHPKLTITEEQASALLLKDVGGAVAAVNNLVTVALTQNQFDALVDFVYNAGAGHLANSTLLRDLNQGHHAEAAAQFPVWDHAAGCVVSGLLKRRQAEQALFLAEEVAEKVGAQRQKEALVHHRATRHQMGAAFRPVFCLWPNSRCRETTVGRTSLQTD